jgi:hypothetical protein
VCEAKWTCSLAFFSCDGEGNGGEIGNGVRAQWRMTNYCLDLISVLTTPFRIKIFSPFVGRSFALSNNYFIKWVTLRIRLSRPKSINQDKFRRQPFFFASPEKQTEAKEKPQTREGKKSSLSLALIE